MPTQQSSEKENLVNMRTANFGGGRIKGHRRNEKNSPIGLIGFAPASALVDAANMEQHQVQNKFTKQQRPRRLKQLRNGSFGGYSSGNSSTAGPDSLPLVN